MPVGTKNKRIPGCGAHHISIQTRDLTKSLQVYRDVLGMEVAAEFGSPERPVVLLDMGDGSHIELVGGTSASQVADPRSPQDPILHFALATTNTRLAIERVRESGCEVTVEPRDVDLKGLSATIAFFKGPNGEEIEFFQTH